MDKISHKNILNTNTNSKGEIGENDLCTHKQARTLGKETSEEEGMLSDHRRPKTATNQPPRRMA
ncbi:hypothetical protein QJS10_CPB11g01783 [Acorus calamus]|uniref:Uncharacterized protein n=1 Tax=Acorus calamus TaxID=4465 RepID=A0AAV9DRG8_ACOCL|nr:hypothetical protein QJS10_CPB11g01783 [Acorus calamus]